MLNCLKTILKVNIKLVEEKDVVRADTAGSKRVLQIQTIRQQGEPTRRADSQIDQSFAFYTIRLLVDQDADNLVYLGCRRHMENRNYETEVEFMHY